MCGIAGFFNLSEHSNGFDRPDILLKKMLDAIRHRGPDDRGQKHEDWYGLGHVRLSIIDTSKAGHQPMWSPDNRFGLAYNGELYNHEALRRDLESHGHKFRSNSDTEVMLYAFIEWGVKAFEKFEGMFAAAFIDKKNREAFIVRDHLGIKPLYYIQKGSTLVFSSEVKGLKPFTNQFSLNQNALFEQFHFRFISGERTLYQDVQRLLPGSYIHIRADKNIQLKTYYRVTNSLKDHPKNNYDLKTLEEKINQSIRAHTISDVGYAVQLSGGIDSSYITTLLKQNQANLDTYSITLPGNDHDEATYQRQVSEHCSTNHHTYACNGKEFADLLPEVIHHLDFPVVHGGTVFLYMLCHHIRKKHKVVLTGEGADELLLGYSRYNIPWSHKFAFALQSLKINPDHLPNLPKIQGLKNIMNRPLGLDAGIFYSDLSSDILNIDGDLTYRRDIAENYSTLLGRMIATDQTSYLGSLLERQDKISMAHGVEVRVPFCNHRLFDLINPIRHHLKNKPVPKTILKTLLTQWYPHDFVYRRKNGFTIPLDDWFKRDDMLGRYLGLLNDQTFHNRGFYNTKTIPLMVDRHRAGTHRYGKELFNLVSFEIWIRQMNQPAPNLKI